MLVKYHYIRPVKRWLCNRGEHNDGCCSNSKTSRSKGWYCAKKKELIDGMSQMKALKFQDIKGASVPDVVRIIRLKEFDSNIPLVQFSSGLGLTKYPGQQEKVFIFHVMMLMVAVGRMWGQNPLKDTEIPVNRGKIILQANRSIRKECQG